MATSVKVTTPIPTANQIARRLGISGARKETIFRLAQDSVSSFYKTTDAGKKPSARKSKAA